MADSLSLNTHKSNSLQVRVLCKNNDLSHNTHRLTAI